MQRGSWPYLEDPALAGTRLVCRAIIQSLCQVQPWVTVVLPSMRGPEELKVRAVATEVVQELNRFHVQELVQPLCLQTSARGDAYRGQLPPSSDCRIRIAESVILLYRAAYSTHCRGPARDFALPLLSVAPQQLMALPLTDCKRTFGEFARLQRDGLLLTFPYIWQTISEDSWRVTGDHALVLWDGAGSYLLVIVHCLNNKEATNRVPLLRAMNRTRDTCRSILERLMQSDTSFLVLLGATYIIWGQNYGDRSELKWVDDQGGASLVYEALRRQVDLMDDGPLAAQCSAAIDPAPMPPLPAVGPRPGAHEAAEPPLGVLRGGPEAAGPPIGVLPGGHETAGASIGVLPGAPRVAAAHQHPFSTINNSPAMADKGECYHVRVGQVVRPHPCQNIPSEQWMTSSGVEALVTRTCDKVRRSSGLLACNNIPTGPGLLGTDSDPSSTGATARSSYSPPGTCGQGSRQVGAQREMTDASCEEGTDIGGGQVLLPSLVLPSRYDAASPTVAPAMLDGCMAPSWSAEHRGLGGLRSSVTDVSRGQRMERGKLGRSQARQMDGYGRTLPQGSLETGRPLMRGIMQSTILGGLDVGACQAGFPGNGFAAAEGPRIAAEGRILGDLAAGPPSLVKSPEVELIPGGSSRSAAVEDWGRHSTADQGRMNLTNGARLIDPLGGSPLRTTKDALEEEEEEEEEGSNVRHVRALNPEAAGDPYEAAWQLGHDLIRKGPGPLGHPPAGGMLTSATPPDQVQLPQVQDVGAAVQEPRSPLGAKNVVGGTDGKHGPHIEAPQQDLALPHPRHVGATPPRISPVHSRGGPHPTSARNPSLHAEVPPRATLRNTSGPLPSVVAPPSVAIQGPREVETAAAAAAAAASAPPGVQQELQSMMSTDMAQRSHHQGGEALRGGLLPAGPTEHQKVAPIHGHSTDTTGWLGPAEVLELSCNQEVVQPQGQAVRSGYEPQVPSPQAPQATSTLTGGCSASSGHEDTRGSFPSRVPLSPSCPLRCTNGPVPLLWDRRGQGGHFPALIDMPMQATSVHGLPSGGQINTPGRPIDYMVPADMTQAAARTPASDEAVRQGAVPDVSTVPDVSQSGREHGCPSPSLRVHHQGGRIPGDEAGPSASLQEKGRMGAVCLRSMGLMPTAVTGQLCRNILAHPGPQSLGTLNGVRCEGRGQRGFPAPVQPALPALQPELVLPSPVLLSEANPGSSHSVSDIQQVDNHSLHCPQLNPTGEILAEKEVKHPPGWPGHDSPLAMFWPTNPEPDSPPGLGDPVHHTINPLSALHLGQYGPRRLQSSYGRETAAPWSGTGPVLRSPAHVSDQPGPQSKIKVWTQPSKGSFAHQTTGEVEPNALPACTLSMGGCDPPQRQATASAGGDLSLSSVVRVTDTPPGLQSERGQSSPLRVEMQFPPQAACRPPASAGSGGVPVIETRLCSHTYQEGSGEELLECSLRGPSTLSGHPDGYQHRAAPSAWEVPFITAQGSHVLRPGPRDGTLLLTSAATVEGPVQVRARQGTVSQGPHTALAINRDTEGPVAEGRPQYPKSGSQSPYTQTPEGLTGSLVAEALPGAVEATRQLRTSMAAQVGAPSISGDVKSSGSQEVTPAPPVANGCQRPMADPSTGIFVQVNDQKVVSTCCPVGLSPSGLGGEAKNSPTGGSGVDVAIQTEDPAPDISRPLPLEQKALKGCLYAEILQIVQEIRGETAVYLDELLAKTKAEGERLVGYGDRFNKLNAKWMQKFGDQVVEAGEYEKILELFRMFEKVRDSCRQSVALHQDMFTSFEVAHVRLLRLFKGKKEGPNGAVSDVSSVHSKDSGNM